LVDTNRMKIVLLFALLLPFSLAAQSDIIGQWKTIDEETGDETSIVEIIEKKSKIYGKIIKIFPGPKDEKDPVCEQCDEDDPRYGKKVIGMEILQGLEKEGNEYTGGSVLDPKNGKVYRCKIWREGTDLKIRGYLGPFYRTQTWKKVH
jgi:uncharacterized protein (DUF2147 family)